MPYTGQHRTAMAGRPRQGNAARVDRAVSGRGKTGNAPAYIMHTAGQPHRYYLSYFGESQPREVDVVVPPDERYDATLIDTWEMTETPLAERCLSRRSAQHRVQTLSGAAAPSRLNTSRKAPHMSASSIAKMGFLRAEPCRAECRQSLS